MKQIPNPIYTLPDAPSAAALLRIALNVPPSRDGWTLAAMRARNRVLDVLDKILAPGGEIVLEDADYSTALEAVKAMDGHWGVNHPDILKFCELFGL